MITVQTMLKTDNICNEFASVFSMRELFSYHSQPEVMKVVATIY